MIRTAREVAKNYPGIDLWETNIDAQCMWLVKNPEDYEVIVAENMFGDILSDLGCTACRRIRISLAPQISVMNTPFLSPHTDRRQNILVSTK
jgi:isocitrate/isopropylmalate dehydrogenase